MNKKITQAVILMAGKGTRFLPATKAVAKELFPIGNKPVLLFHLMECYKSGIKRVCLVISKEKEYVKNLFVRNKAQEDALKPEIFELLDELNTIIDHMDITFVYQGEMNGSGGAVCSVEDWAGGQPFAIFNGDDVCAPFEGEPVIGQLMQAYERTGKNIVALKTIPLDIISKYSCVITEKKLFNDCFLLSDIIEKPENPQSDLTSMARYVVDSQIFDEIRHSTPRKGEYCLTDALANMAKNGKVAGLKFKGDYYDCGNKLEFLKCMVDFGLHEPDIKDDFLTYLTTKTK